MHNLVISVEFYVMQCKSTKFLNLPYNEKNNMQVISLQVLKYANANCENTYQQFICNNTLRINLINSKSYSRESCSISM